MKTILASQKFCYIQRFHCKHAHIIQRRVQHTLVSRWEEINEEEGGREPERERVTSVTLVQVERRPVNQTATTIMCIEC